MTTENPLAEIYREHGPWSWAYLDVSGDVADPRRMAEHRRRSTRDTLEAAGAPAADVDAVDEILSDQPGIPSPACRYILMSGGDVALDEVLPGSVVGEETTGFGPVPDLVPLLRHRPQEFGYLVVEAGKDGARVRLYRAGSAAPEHTDTVEGSTESIKKVQVGGLSQARYQRHSEDVWMHNMEDVASVVDRLVLDHHPRLLLVAGDVRAVQLLQDQLAEGSREILATISSNTRPDDASDDALQAALARELARISDADHAAALDHLEKRSGQESAFGLGEVVHALQQAQADSVFIDLERLRDRSLIALAAEPWITAAPEEALDVEQLGSVAADVALVRAAALTDATVVFAGASGLPQNADAAAALRWSTGPARVGEL